MQPQSVVVSATPASKTPNILNGVVNGIATVGNRIVVGGTFTSVKSSNGTTLNRSELLSFNPPPVWSTPILRPCSPAVRSRP